MDLHKGPGAVPFRSDDLTRILLGLALLFPRAARAEDLGVSPADAVGASPTAGEASSRHTARRIDRTAYTLDQHQVDVGVESAAFAPVDELMVGTYVPTWLLFPILGAPVPTGFIKARTPFVGPFAASVRANVIYVSGASLRSELAEANSANGSLWIVPVELAVSASFLERASESLELMYVGISGSGNQDGSTTIRGSAAATSLTLSSFSEFRVGSGFAVTLLARVLVHQDAARVQGSASTDGTQVDFNLGVRRQNSFVACLAPGIELDFARAHLDLALGYGSFWLPILELPLASYGPVPEANFYLRF
jgi:hypothetical protein